MKNACGETVLYRDVSLKALEEHDIVVREWPRADTGGRMVQQRPYRRREHAARRDVVLDARPPHNGARQDVGTSSGETYAGEQRAEGTGRGGSCGQSRSHNNERVR